jgi:hypothetical protein
MPDTPHLAPPPQMRSPTLYRSRSAIRAPSQPWPCTRKPLRRCMPTERSPRTSPGSWASPGAASTECWLRMTRPALFTARRRRHMRRRTPEARGGHAGGNRSVGMQNLRPQIKCPTWPLASLSRFKSCSLPFAKLATPPHRRLIGLRPFEDSLTSMGHRRHSAARPVQSTPRRLPGSRSQEAFGRHHRCPRSLYQNPFGHFSE